MAEPNELSAQEIGRRLRLARENAKIRQVEAAKVIGLSRPTLVSIEKGDRQLRIQELQALAHRYGVSVNSIYSREAVHTDIVPRFRKLRSAKQTHAEEAIMLLCDLMRAEVELENILGIQHRKNYPQERSINTGDVAKLAEQHAQELRNWLGLGSGSVTDIFSLLEYDLGVRLYQRPLSSDSKIAGLFIHDASIGACILLNSNQSVEHRIQSAAYELGNFVGSRQAPDVLKENQQFLSRKERYASAFGRAFLTPRKSFEAAFRQLTAGMATLTRRHVALLAQQHHISLGACVGRLEELGLVKKGLWARFKANGDITNSHATVVLAYGLPNTGCQGGISNADENNADGKVADRSDPSGNHADQAESFRIGQMAYAAWKRELLSEGQLSEILNLPRVNLRKLLDQFEFEESDTDDLLKLPHR